jgi:hypothetical protein
VTDEEIRALLARIDPAAMIRVPRGNVAILLARVESTTGGDLGDVSAWVMARGGKIECTPTLHRAPAARGSRSAAGSIPGNEYYVVPTEALRA